MNRTLAFIGVLFGIGFHSGVSSSRDEGDTLFERAHPGQLDQPERTKLMRVRHLTKVMVDLRVDGGVTPANRERIAINLYFAGTGIGNINGPSIQSTIEVLELLRSAAAMHAYMKASEYVPSDATAHFHYADEAILLLLKQEYEAMDPSLRKEVFSDKLMKTLAEWFPGEFEIRDRMLWPPLGKSATASQLYWPAMFTPSFNRRYDHLFRDDTLPY